MSKKARLVLVVLGLFALMALPACSRKKNPSRLPPPPGEVKGELHVALATPLGQTKSPGEAAEIVVIFDHPMAALEPLPLDESTSFLKLEPAFPGTFRWMGTRALSFRPKDRFPAATEIRATVPAGTRSNDGYALKQDYSWTFSTVRPQLVGHMPAEDAEQLRLDQTFTLIFNQAVAETEAKEFIALSGISDAGPAEAALPFSLTRPSAAELKEAGITRPASDVLTLRPSNPLKPDCRYTVEVKAGFKGREGALPMETGASFGVQTFKTFAFTELEGAEAHVPNESYVFRFTNNVAYKDLAAKIRFEPKVEIPAYYEDWDQGSRELWLNLALKPEAKYTVVIAADLKDEFGNALGKDARVELTTAAYAPMVSMTTGQGVLESYAELTYPLYIVNADQVRLQAARVPRDGVLPLIRADKAFRTSESFAPPGGYQIDKPLAFKLPRNVRQFVPLNVKELLGDKFGLLFVQLDTASEDKWSRYPKAFLQVTELGITGKFSPDADLIWVTELRTGEPVAGADIEIRSDENAVLWTGRTDKDGRAEAPGWKGLGLKAKDAWSKPRQWVFARRGPDTAFASSDWGTGIDPYRFNIAYDWAPEPEKYRGTVFSERGIYRAGEAVHLKGIVRRNVKGQWQLPALRDVACEIRDPFQKSVYKGRAALDAFGSFALDFETRPDASLGTYALAAVIPPEAKGGKETRISQSFRVEAFRPAEFEVHLRALKDSFVFGDAFQAEVRGAYLYGGAMAGQKASWTLRLDAAAYEPPNHPGFAFGTQMEAADGEENLAERSRLLASGDAALGPDGKIDVKANLIPEKENRTVSATLEATIEGPSRRAVSNRIQAFVHQGEFYIGLKPGTSFLKQGEPLPVQVITTAADGAAAPDKKVTVRLLRREWHSTRKAGVGGRFKWHTEKVDTEVASQDVRTKADPVEIAFKPDKAGFYLVTAAGQDGRKNAVTTATDVYVTGKDYVPWQRRDDDALDLVADRDRYKPGDTARILVKSPYEKAKALVTVERETILTSRVVEIQGSASEIAIPVTADLIPNAFVSVILVQGRTKASSDATTEDIGKPSFKAGYASLSVDPSARRLTVEVTPDKKGYKPRETVTVGLKVKNAAGAGRAASLAVAAVDVGVLNLIGYQTPDPFADFYGERPLSVETADTRLNVVGQRKFSEKGENQGGGGAEAAGLAGLGQVQLRGDFKTTVFWNASVATDAQGEATVRFTLPDNLTTFRIMAVAQTQDSLFGSGAAEFKVAKPLLLLPSIPRFARVGDRFQAGVVVSNFSDRKGTVTIGCEVRGLKAADAAAPREVLLSPGESREVLYALEAEAPGRASLAVRAKMGEDSDGLDIGFPVDMPRPTETVAAFGQVTQEPRQETINLPDAIYPEQSRIDVHASASALTGLSGTVEYLANYPYLCLEQRLSSALPFIIAPQVIRDFKMSPLDDQAIRKSVAETIRTVYAYQKDSGGFGLWTDSESESPFASCYAAFALMKAQAAGYEVDAGRLNGALGFLKNFVKAKPDRHLYPYDARSWTSVQAFALYVLASAGQPQPAYAEKLYLERDSLTLFGRSCLLKALHAGNGSPEAEAALRTGLLNKIKIAPSQAHFEEEDEASLGWIYSSQARTTAVVLQALIETAAPVPVLPDLVRWLVEESRAGRWRSTQENFFVFYALSEYYRTAESAKPDFKAEVRLAGKRILQEAFSAATQAARASAPLTELKVAKGLALEFAKSGPGTFYYGARLTYAPKSVLAPRDEGFAVYKSLETLDGKPLEEIKAGSVVVVVLQVVVPKESLFVVVDDPLPAGFEAVDATFATESDEAQRRLDALSGAGEEPWWQGFDHAEIRDDKVLLFADSLTPGIHTHRYLARALSFGTFALPGTKAEAMYEPEVFGRSVERSVKIVK